MEQKQTQDVHNNLKHFSLTSSKNHPNEKETESQGKTFEEKKEVYR